jgi:hypothetical protein
MFELVEIAEHKHIRNRIFPIVLTDADIYDPMKRIEYVKYWEIKKNDLADAIKRVDPANLQGIREDIDHYNRFRNEISGLITTLKDMNTLTPKMHQDTDFSKLYDAIVKRINNFSESNVAPLIKKNNIVVQLRKMAGTGPAQVTSSERLITFGRGGHNLVVINHPQISWEHGQMLLQEGIFRYRHLSRSNSTTIESLVNRSIQKLQPGENNDYPLFSKDLLIFGDRLATYIISYNMVDDGQEYVPTETLPLPSL